MSSRRDGSIPNCRRLVESLQSHRCDGVDVAVPFCWPLAGAVDGRPDLLRCASRCSETNCRRQEESRRRSRQSAAGGRPWVMDSFPGSGSPRKGRDWVRSGSKPGNESERRGSTAMTGMDLQETISHSAGRGCSPAMPVCSDEMSWPCGREIDDRAHPACGTASPPTHSATPSQRPQT